MDRHDDTAPFGDRILSFAKNAPSIEIANNNIGNSRTFKTTSTDFQRLSRSIGLELSTLIFEDFPGFSPCMGSTASSSVIFV